MSQLNNEIKVGGTLERVIRCSDGHVFEQQKHNTIVDQGMHMMLTVPAENTYWYNYNFVLGPSIGLSGSIFKGIARCNYSDVKNLVMAHTGVAMFMACGSSDAATTADMTQLNAFAGDPTQGSSYGSTQGGYFKWNQQVSENNVLFTAKYRYSYTATSNFTCKEFGTYTLLLTSTPDTTSYDGIMAWSSYTPKLFSRVVLTEPIEMTAGETYTFDYTLRFSMSYRNTYIAHDDIFGLNAVKYEHSWSLKTQTTDYAESNNSKFASTTTFDKVFASESNVVNDILDENGLNIQMLSNGAAFSLSNGSGKAETVNDFTGLQFAPSLVWNDSAEFSATNNRLSVPTNQYNSDFNVTKSMPVKRQPDEVGDFYSVTTYTFTIPYSDTTDKYLAIWTPMYWYAVNATLDETGNLTWNPYPRNNMYEYTLTCKTVLTREEG